MAYIKARALLGCSSKDIFNEIKVVYGVTSLSYDTVRRRKNKFKSGLQSVEMHQNH
jgi:hypothetical protein